MYQPAQAITVDLAESALQDGLRAITAGQTQFDLSKVAAVDSSAVAVLLNWQRAAVAASSAVRFSNVPASLISLMQVYGVDGLLAVDIPALAIQEPSHHRASS